MRSKIERWPIAMPSARHPEAKQAPMVTSETKSFSWRLLRYAVGGLLGLLTLWGIFTGLAWY